MLRAHLLILLSLFIGISSFAQPPQGGGDKKVKREKIKAQKIAFISTELDLTTDEAQKFWPVYNEYEAAIDAIRKERRSYHKELKKSKDLSGDRAYELFELIFETEIKESNIRLNYLKQFSTVIGKKKAAEVFIAEERFKRQLLDKLKHEGHPPPPGGGNRP